MNTYQINIQKVDFSDAPFVAFIKTSAEVADVNEAIDFIKRGELSVEKLLQALRILGFKATEVKIEPVHTFEV